jgi:hypothetical protein
VKYVYKCGCEREDFVNGKTRGTTLYKFCPEHGAKLTAKIRLCAMCEKSFEVSVRSNCRNWVCPECRPARDLILAKAARDRRKAGHIPKKTVKTDRKQRVDRDPLEVLSARRVEMPVVSDALRGVFERAGVI